MPKAWIIQVFKITQTQQTDKILKLCTGSLIDLFYNLMNICNDFKFALGYFQYITIFCVCSLNS